MVRVVQFLAVLALLAFSFPATALAHDWLVTKLRGEALQLVGNDWAPLNRGDVVPDDRVIRTLASGRAMLQRGNETIELAANTQIRIFDKAGKRFTTVQQHFGTIAIEAEVRNVKHFAVQTPYLAAVVKGTRFEVKTTSRQSKVKVQRGLVAVEDGRTGLNAMVAAGQSASIDKGGAFAVGGTGAKPEILSEAGETVSPEDAANGKAVAPGQLKKIGADAKIKTNNGNGSANASANSAVAGSVGGNGNGNGGGNGKGKGNSASGTTP